MSLDSLFHAVNAGNLEETRQQAFQMHVQQITFVDFKKRNGDTPLHLASRLGRCDLLQVLLPYISIDTTNSDGKSALHEAASAGKFSAASFLLSHGAEVDKLKRADWTPLMMACTKESSEVIQLLLQHDASTGLRNKDGWNAFHIAARSGHVNNLKFLLSHDSQCWDTQSKTRRTPLHTAALHGNGDVVNFLLSSCSYDLNSKDSCGSTPLHDALRNGHISVVTSLLLAGCDPAPTDALNRSPIHTLAESATITLTEVLEHTKEAHVKLKLDVNSQCSGGYTPLHLAAREGHACMVGELIEMGADPFLMDNHQNTALEIAKNFKREACISLLENAMSKVRQTDDHITESFLKQNI